MKALTVTETSSGSWVSDRAVCTTLEQRHGSQKQQADVYKEKNICVFLQLYLVNKRPSVGVALQQHTGPKLGIFAPDQVARQALEKGILIANLVKTHRIESKSLDPFKSFGCASNAQTKYFILTLISSWSH